MNTKEYAGIDLAKIRSYFADEEGFTKTLHEDAESFDAWKPFNELPSHECVHVVVWPRADGGFWSEEY